MTVHSLASRLQVISISLAVLLGSIGGCEASQINVLTRMEEGKEPMSVHKVGRFSVSVPSTMRETTFHSKLRKITIKEFSWPLGLPHELAINNLWKARLQEIREMEPPQGKKEALIEVRDLSHRDTWAKAAFYYGSDISDSQAKWDALIDKCDGGIWFKTDSILLEPLNVEKALNNLQIIANAYRSRMSADISVVQGKNLFFTRNGAIDLPYRWQESTNVSFEGHPLRLKLSIEMQETHHVEQAGLIERLGAAIATRYALGVDVHKIRGRKRTIAGLKGEDVIIRMKDKDGSMLSFAWEYPGEENSGERPEIQITMESPDGDAEEKIKVWDAILESFKPMYATKR